MLNSTLTARSFSFCAGRSQLLELAIEVVEMDRLGNEVGADFTVVRTGEDVFARDADWHGALALDITTDRILQTV